MTLLHTKGLKIDGQELWDGEHAPSKMHELHVWMPVDIPENVALNEEYDRDRIIQIHQNLNLSRTAELTNASAKYLKQLVLIGWVMVALLFLIFLSGAS